MKKSPPENAIIVINKTRLEQLTARFNTKAQAKFYIEHAGGNFEDYEIEHKTFKKSLEIIQRKISTHLKRYKVVERQYVPNFIFTEKDIVIVVGQDGLVANTAKYVNDIPIIAVNPDPTRYDGILLPFDPANFESTFLKTLAGNPQIKSVTMAEARLNDGQRLLAFNDLFIGHSSHISARYKITFDNYSENQSSSGIIISTGAGSTGWLSSLFNMAAGINRTFGKSSEETSQFGLSMTWDEKRLVFIVREPFLSKYSRVDLTTGLISPNKKLVLESFMPTNGVIFSDGIEADFLHFNSGSIAEIGIAKERALIVQK
jgi:NAD kinase